VEGRVIGCVCEDGRSGNQVCTNDQFGPCECTGELTDAGAEGDAGEGDAGFDDAGFEERDSGSRDTGPRDIGADDGGPRDTGVRDVGVPDVGFPDTGASDTGPRDVGFPDTGVRDAGFFDAGSFDAGSFDASFPDFDGGVGSACTSDLDCNVGLPLAVLICEQNACEFSCFYYELFESRSICVSPQVCDWTTGRCL
jgi:hypothetical protein